MAALARFSAHGRALCRRACAASSATPQLAMRDRTLSARLVRMIGHARAEHEAGAVGVGQEAELLGEDVAGFEIGREQDVGIAGDRRT